MSNLSKIVVLISGTGSNLQAILEACANKELAAKVIAVISNKADAKGLEHARRFAIPTIIKTKLVSQSREQYDYELAEIIAQHQPDWIVLAGWMRILSNVFLQRFPNQVINLHPALPGKFPGTNAIERAFNAYKAGNIQHTGVMVHFVPDEAVDSGPILGEKTIPIETTDSLGTLTARVHQIEHQLLIEVLQKITSFC